ncbi:MAG: asparaginase domain-containing protein [Treponema sp.]|jgi:aspartyl-tRNA(Asn)/glutamyl-tRNA(Gln) amidotransferase subunit B|nr:asparaginase domain-containing protein [Treponema sp.]
MVLKSYISLETRILLPTAVKTFCLCGPGESCPVCRGEGGAPQLNPLAFRKAALLIRGLGGELVPEVPYELKLRLPPGLSDPPGRKPPVSFSRYSLKLGRGAFIDIMFHRRKKRVAIPEIRLEEDTGRLIREGGELRTDYSRAGLPSLRIRTAPDFELGEETEVFLSNLRRRIQYFELMSGLPESLVPEFASPEEGGGQRAVLEDLIRCNAYVAISGYPNPPANFVKLRNLNSFNFVSKAVNAELSRQEGILTGGGTVAPESRIWNESRNASESFKSREGGARAEFSLPEGVAPFRPEPGLLDEPLPELPANRCRRLINDYGLTQFQAEFLCDEKSRADYFEETAGFGAGPREAAQWMASCVIKEFKRLGFSPAKAPLTPERFARILRMLKSRRIHGSIAKQLIPAVLKENWDPGDIIRERGWEQLNDRKAIELIVRSVIRGNPQEVGRIREGDSGPFQFLTGLVMKESGGLADPLLVRDILREELSVSLIYVLSMGGALSGRAKEDGAAEGGGGQALRELLAQNPAGEGEKPRIRVETVPTGRNLPEELVPSGWAALVESVAEKLNSGNTRGIVIAHGAGALSYTAPLLYWLFAGSKAPVVLAASSAPPGRGDEAGRALNKAAELALKESGGVYVVHGGKVLSPLNLKFERIGQDGFRNWNQERPVFSGGALLTGPLEADRYILSQLLEEAVNSICVIRVYPGLRADYLNSLMDQGVKNFFLELYDAAGFREGPYSLKRAFAMGRRRGVRFYCSSQQEGPADFSLCPGSREIQREGLVSMGPYTTETAVALFLAASIIADSEDERAGLMKKAAEGSGGA